MRTFDAASRAICVAGALLLTSCQQGTHTAPKPSTAAEQAAATDAWPATLKVMGAGFPSPGDPCRRIGETAATVDFLDHTATLAGCRSRVDAERLAGKVVGTVDGVTLVSVPHHTGRPGDGDGQGDAKVAGTDYHATAQIPCAGYRHHAAGTCAAGVKRNTAGGLIIVDLTWPDGESRSLYFDQQGASAGADTSQADGSAAYAVVGTRKGDATIVTIGPERYEIPDAFLQGD